MAIWFEDVPTEQSPYVKKERRVVERHPVSDSVCTDALFVAKEALA